MSSGKLFQSGAVGPCPIEEVAQHKAVAVFGAGQGGCDVSDVLLRYGVRVAAFLDNDPQKQGREMEGVPVMSLGEFMTLEALPVVVGSAWAHEIIPQCRDAGVRRIYDMNWFCVLFMREPGTWLEPMALLADPESKATYSLVLYGMMNRWFDTRVATSPFPRHAHPAVSIEDGDVVICGGLYDGAPALALLAQADCRVHAFEPMTDHRLVAEERLAAAGQRARVAVRSEGLYSKTGEMPFKCIGFGTHVVPGRVDAVNEGLKRLPVITVDDYAAGTGLESVDLIQLEIEGAELAALKGARRTLESFRPKLQISMGKRFREYGQAVTYLHNLDLGYEFFVGHHTQVWNDTVLYARVGASA